MNARLSVAALCVAALSACSEPSQDLHSDAAHGGPEYNGTGSNFVAPGWTQGNEASWKQEMTVRTQRGQNEYNKIN